MKAFSIISSSMTSVETSSIILLKIVVPSDCNFPLSKKINFKMIKKLLFTLS